MPNATVIELNGQSVRRKEGSLAPVFRPDMAGIIHPSARREPGLVDQIHVPALHGDKRKTGAETVLHAAILSIQVRPLRMRSACSERAERRRDGNDT